MENGDNSEAWCYWWQKVVMNNDVVPFKVAYFSLFQFSLPLREWESVETQLRPLGNATLVACLLLHWQPRCSNVLVVRASDWYIFRRSWVRILAGTQKFFHEFISHSLGTISLLFHFLKQRAAVAIQREIRRLYLTPYQCDCFDLAISHCFVCVFSIFEQNIISQFMSASCCLQ